MTVKRFTIEKKGGMFYIFDTGNLIQISDGQPICDLLNELHDEKQSSKEFIEQLQQELVLFKKAGADMGIDLNAQITALKKENEQLKQRINVLDDQITAQGIVIEGYQNRNQKLFDEKEHIKHTIKTMIETERTELGQSVLKQLWEQIE